MINSFPDSNSNCYSTVVELSPDVYRLLQQFLQDKPDLNLNKAIERGLLMLIRHEDLNKIARCNR